MGLARTAGVAATLLSLAPAARAQTSAPSQPAPSQPPPAPSQPPPAEIRTPLVAPAPTAASSAAAPMPSPVQTISPARDQQQLDAQGSQRPSSGEVASSASTVFAEDWWTNPNIVFDIHGYFRTRAELLHNFTLGRHNSSTVAGNDPQYMWPSPLDQGFSSFYPTQNGTSVNVCGNNSTPNSGCNDKTESGANMRFRLEPSFQISENLRVLSQIDLLDNMVLGSTPNSYAMQPGTSSGIPNINSTTGYSPPSYSGGYAPVNYAPISFLSSTQGPPTAGINGWTNSINVQRVWGEYDSPLGQLRFGRMPDQWGLGMVANAGNGIDSDYQTNIDRIMFMTGVKSLDLLVGGAWDFISTGPTNANPFDVYGGQPYNTCNSCNVNEWALWLVHKQSPERQRAALAHGDLVVSGGLYTTYRTQSIDLQAGGTPWTTPYGYQTSPTAAPLPDNGLESRQAWAITPDAWVQALWHKLRFEAEFVTVQGQIGNLAPPSNNPNTPTNIQQYGLATQTEFRAVDDKLDLQFGFGWASGDAYAQNSTGPGGTGVGALQPPTQGSQTQVTSAGQPSPIETFRFHPDYRIDLIFWRDIMTRIEGAYYFRPSVDYDFIRHTDGEKVGGGAAVIWSRASQFLQTPGHQRDLGVELDLQLYYQSADGSLNDDPSKLGGFYAALQYGVFFPLGGLDYLPGQSATAPAGTDTGVSAAQTARLILGIAF